MLDKPSLRSLSELFESCTYTIGFYMHWPELDKYNIIKLLGLLTGSSTIVKKFTAWRESITKDVLDRSENTSGIFARISRARGQEYSDSQLVAEAITLLIIGESSNSNLYNEVNPLLTLFC